MLKLMASSPATPAPTGFRVSHSIQARHRNLWELALPAMRPARTTQTRKIDVEADGLIAGNAGSHRVPGQPQHPGPTQELVGAGIASDEAGKNNTDPQD